MNVFEQNVWGKKQERRRHVLSEETSRDFGTRTKASRRISRRRLAHDTAVTKYSPKPTTKLLRLKAYKFTAMQRIRKKNTLLEYSFAAGSMKQCLVVKSNPW